MIFYFLFFYHLISYIICYIATFLCTEQLMADTDLNGLDVIADDQQAIKTQRATVQRIATHTLTQGLQTMDRLKVSYNSF